MRELTLQEANGPGGRGPEAFAVVADLVRFRRAMVVAIRAVLRERGLSFREYMLLMTLSMSSTGNLPLSVLAARLLAPVTTVSQQVDRLEARGLIERGPRSSDRRITVVALTERGRSAVAEATTDLSVIEFGFHRATSDDLCDLTATCARMGSDLADRYEVRRSSST